MLNDALCEESSVHKKAGYNEAFGSGDESEDFLPSSERETSAQSPDDDESYTEGGEKAEDGGEDEVEEGRGEGGSDGDNVDVDGDEESSGWTSEGPGDNRSFFLPKDWAVNKFLPMISDKIFRELGAVIKFQTISQSVSRERTRDITQREPLMLAYMMPRLLQV